MFHRRILFQKMKKQYFMINHIVGGTKFFPPFFPAGSEQGYIHPVHTIDINKYKCSIDILVCNLYAPSKLPPFRNKPISKIFRMEHHCPCIYVVKQL